MVQTLILASALSAGAIVGIVLGGILLIICLSSI